MHENVIVKLIIRYNECMLIKRIREREGGENGKKGEITRIETKGKVQIFLSTAT